MRNVSDFVLTSKLATWKHAFLVLHQARSAALEKGITLYLHSDHELFLEDMFVLSGSRSTNFDFEQPQFTALRAISEDGTTVGTCCWFLSESSSLKTLLQADSLHFHQAIPNLPEITNHIRGKVVFSGGVFVAPSQRQFNGLLSILRNAFFAIVYDQHDPDFIVGLILSKDTKRGAGLHLLYGFPEYSEPFIMKGLYPDSDASVRLMWVSRLGAKNFMSRVSKEDWGR